MIVSFKDGVKLIGLSVVSFCAVFVCTFFLNFYLDAVELEGTFTDPAINALYEAQMVTAKFVSVLCGGFLGFMSVVILIFYVKLYIDGHGKQLGILKGMGYSNGKIALGFFVFGFSVFIGSALGFGVGFAIMPLIYKNLTIDGIPQIDISFHTELLFALVFLPVAVFSAFACGYAYLALKRPVCDMLRGKDKVKLKKEKAKENNGFSFLTEMCFKTLGDKKALAFFVAFACFCFSAMIQMSVSMIDLSSEIMGAIILVIGLILAVTTLLMAITSLVKGNIKSISIMKAFGYSMKECSFTVLGGYHIFALIGFFAGTLYQFVILKLMINVVFKDVAQMPEYSFGVSAFFITLAAFIVFYSAVVLFYSFKINKISVKEVMTET